MMRSCASGARLARPAGLEGPASGYRSEAQRIALRNSVLKALFWNRSALWPNWKYTFRPLYCGFVQMTG